MFDLNKLDRYNLVCIVLNSRDKILLNLKNWYIWVFVIAQKSKRPLEALKLHSKMKKVQLDEISYLHFEFEFDQKCRRNFCRFFPKRVPDNFFVFRNCIETDFRRKISHPVCSTSELSDSGKLPFLSFSKNVKCNLLLQSPETSSQFFFNYLLLGSRSKRVVWKWFEAIIKIVKMSINDDDVGVDRRKKWRCRRFFPGFTSLGNFFCRQQLMIFFASR